ncbi:hypothetical protein KKC88_01915 [Patescibacteria group bacterium]|nr:hypothetical protein [Patescibacteria group bacterium]MBU1673878.1 hypothetical protein [Patescibacteria group bacterium]MBU1963255.1 hypothetical protein [Patescibacteria group bacterium]
MKEYKNQNLSYQAGLIIGGIIGLFWCALILNELIGVERVSYINIIQTLIIGGLILVTVGIACITKLIGGILLVVESVIALLLIIFYGLNYFPTFIIILLLPVPVFLAGILFIISHLTSTPKNKKAKTTKPTKKKTKSNNKTKKKK